jgi:hypothetical protein
MIRIFPYHLINLHYLFFTKKNTHHYSYILYTIIKSGDILFIFICILKIYEISFRMFKRRVLNYIYNSECILYVLLRTPLERKIKTKKKLAKRSKQI